jgi:hypothetical protein
MTKHDEYKLIFDAINNMIGNIEPVGEENEDKQRLQNLQLYLSIHQMMTDLLIDIEQSLCNKDIETFLESRIGDIICEHLNQIACDCS